MSDTFDVKIAIHICLPHMLICSFMSQGLGAASCPSFNNSWLDDTYTGAAADANKKFKKRVPKEE